MDQTKDHFRPDQTTAHERERRILGMEIKLAKRRQRELAASSTTNTTPRSPPSTATSRDDSSVTAGNSHARQRMETVHMPQGFQQSDPASEPSQVPMPSHLEKNLNTSNASEEMDRDVIHTQKVSRGKRFKSTKKSQEEMHSSHEPKDMEPVEGFNEDIWQLLSVIPSFYSTLIRYTLFFLWQLLFPIFKTILTWLLIFVLIALPCILFNAWAICQVPVLSTYLRPCQLNFDNPLCNWNLVSSSVSFCRPSNFSSDFITDTTQDIPRMIRPKSYESSLIASIDQAVSKIDVLRMRVEALHFPPDGILCQRLYSFNAESTEAIDSLHDFYRTQDICMDEVGYSMRLLISKLQVAHTESKQRWQLAERAWAFIYKYVYKAHYERTNIATMIHLYEEFFENIIRRIQDVIFTADKSMQLFKKLKDIANDILEASFTEIALLVTAGTSSKKQVEKMWFWQQTAGEQDKIDRIREQLEVVHEFAPVRDAAHVLLSKSLFEFQTIRDRLKGIAQTFHYLEGGNDVSPEAFLEHMHAIQRQWAALQTAKAQALIQQARINGEKSRKFVQQVNL